MELHSAEDSASLPGIPRPPARRETYQQLLQPHGASLYVVGDQVSPQPGWHEGALASTRYVVALAGNLVVLDVLGADLPDVVCSEGSGVVHLSVDTALQATGVLAHTDVQERHGAGGAGLAVTFVVLPGDLWFPGGPGRTTQPEEFNSLMDGLETKLFDVLPDETWIYPGHGNDTTIGTERPHLAEWRARGW
ncbi:MBL fold metallo-hydrolase [Streptomyces sp. NPDC001975]